MSGMLQFFPMLFGILIEKKANERGAFIMIFRFWNSESPRLSFLMRPHLFLIKGNHICNALVKDLYQELFQRERYHQGKVQNPGNWKK